MRFDGADQQVRIIGSPRVDFVVDHDLVFDLLQYDPTGTEALPGCSVGVGLGVIADNLVNIGHAMKKHAAP
jgi:hypothetical protein